ncbi:thioredoxin-like protein YneN [Flavobacteriaceae bacterium UJ101]|nr:thioredoxin-like protein YneN [Flavobacteriaceae bacterium UJ101]
MKNKNVFLIGLGIIFTMFSCKKNTVSSTSDKGFVTFSGKITNPNSDSLIVFNDSYKKKIEVTKGEFKDTLHVKEGKYTIYDGGEYSVVYLKNGEDLQLTLDTNQFDESITYKGAGADVNNYLAKIALKEEEVFDISELGDLNEADFSKKLDDIKKTLYAFVDENKNFDQEFIKSEKEEVDGVIERYREYFENQVKIRTELAKGTISPSFSNYENIDGSKTSLEDLKGKYVYIDVWATWCGPCKQEIPFLKELEEKYHGKNIEFVSISVDQIQNHDKWIKMVKDKELKGVQLYADNAFDSEFIKSYKINSIPRFILIDPEGKIVSAYTYRPSEKEKIEGLFTELGI